MQRILGIDLVMSIAYHAQTDRQIERTNRTVLQYLYHYVKGMVRTGKNISPMSNLPSILLSTHLLARSPSKLFTDTCRDSFHLSLGRLNSCSYVLRRSQDEQAAFMKRTRIDRNLSSRPINVGEINQHGNCCSAGLVPKCYLAQHNSNYVHARPW